MKIKINYHKGNLKKLSENYSKNDYILQWVYDKNKQSLTGEHSGMKYSLYSTFLQNRERRFIKEGFCLNVVIYSIDQSALKYYEGKEPLADWQTPVPIKFLTVENIKFQFCLANRENDLLQ